MPELVAGVTTIPLETNTEISIQFNVNSIEVLTVARLMQHLSTYFKYEGFPEVLALGPNFFENSKIRILVKNS